MTQNIILKRGSVELPSGLKIQFKEAEILMGGGIPAVEIPEEFKEETIKRKYKKRKEKSQVSEKGKGGGKRKGNEFERDIAEFLKTNEDGFERSEIEAHLKKKEVKFNEKKLTNKLYNMKNAGSIGLEDRKYFLDADYFKEGKGSKFKLND